MTDIPRRIFARPMPTTPEMTVQDVAKRLRRCTTQSFTPQQFLKVLFEESDGDDFDDDDLMILPPVGEDEVVFQSDIDAILAAQKAAAERRRAEVEARIQRRAKRFVRARKAAMERESAQIDRIEREVIEAAVGKGRLAGAVPAHAMHERIAALHAGAPWLDKASAVVMKAMNLATRDGAAALTMPPLILSGPPGIGKSQWARELARLFAVPTVEIDIGATNGATFSLSGIERGWGSAMPGRLVASMLSTHIANPVVILDEIDKIPERVTTSGGGTVPGAFEVLKSMIEPTTARRWTCPYYRVAFDLSAVNWVMTTNSTSALPAAFLDRCKVVELRGPTEAEMRDVVRAWARDFDAPEMVEPVVAQVIAARRHAGRRTSLRQLRRVVDRVVEAGAAPTLM